MFDDRFTYVRSDTLVIYIQSPCVFHFGHFLQHVKQTASIGYLDCHLIEL